MLHAACHLSMFFSRKTAPFSHEKHVNRKTFFSMTFPYLEDKARFPRSTSRPLGEKRRLCRKPMYAYEIPGVEIVDRWVFVLMESVYEGNKDEQRNNVFVEGKGI